MAAVAILALVVFVILPLAANVAGVLILAAATGVGAYRLGLSRRPVAKATITTADPETAMLRQQTARLQHDLDQARAELDQAKASATAAWDAAASRPPRRTLGDTAPLDVLDAEQLAITPMSGARRIGGV